MEPEVKKCAHTLCQCAAEPNSDYCSRACETAGDETDCCCGHPDCHAQA